MFFLFAPASSFFFFFFLKKEKKRKWLEVKNNRLTANR